MDAGDPIVILAGVHIGCFELFGTERVRTIRRSEGQDGQRSPRIPASRLRRQLALQVGLDPQKDVKCVTKSRRRSRPASRRREDRRLPGLRRRSCRRLRAKKIGRCPDRHGHGSAVVPVLLLRGSGQQGVRPQAPGGHQAGPPRDAEGGSSSARWSQSGWPDRSSTGATRGSYDYTLQTHEGVPYSRWREYDPEDTCASTPCACTRRA